MPVCYVSEGAQVCIVAVYCTCIIIMSDSKCAIATCMGS